MSKILSFASVILLTLIVSGCNAFPEIENIGKDDFEVPEIENIGKDDFEVLFEYAQQNGEFDIDDDGRHYFYSFPNNDYAIWVYDDGKIQLIYNNAGSVRSIVTIVEYQYGQLDDGFELFYSYTSDTFDDFGYDDDAIYLPTIGSVIIIFDVYDGTTQSTDEEYAEENTLELFEYVENYFVNRIGIELK